MKRKPESIRAAALPALAQGSGHLFDFLFDLVDLIYDIIGIFNAIIEAWINFGDYLNGE